GSDRRECASGDDSRFARSRPCERSLRPTLDSDARSGLYRGDLPAIVPESQCQFFRASGTLYQWHAAFGVIEGLQCPARLDGGYPRRCAIDYGNLPALRWVWEGGIAQ